MAIKKQAYRSTRIWAEMRGTLNLGPYETLEVKVGEEGEVLGSRAEAEREIGRAIRERYMSECREAMADLPVELRGSAPSGKVAIYFSEEDE